MANKNNTKTIIANMLADGEFHSGEALGQALGISRAAIANHIKALSALGLDIYSITGRGYKIASHIELIKKEKIHEACGQIIPVETFSIIDSTNEFLMQKIRSEESIEDTFTVVAECQTNGRGRRGRKWLSPFGAHLYFSQYRVMEDGLSAAAGLSLAVGLAVKKTCEQFCDQAIELKWPNDVLCGGKKLAGILIEAEGQSDGQCHLVIGIGINFNMPKEAGEEIEQPWTDMNTLADQSIDRNTFVARLCSELEQIVVEYKAHRLERLIPQWNQANAFRDQEVDIIANTSVKTGKCLGIDSSGALLLEAKESGRIEKVFGGEVSLRRAGE